MRPVLDESTAPDPASGAVSFRQDLLPAVPSLDERDVWRAVGASLLATLRSWLR